jgi:hypothetical protein
MRFGKTGRFAVGVLAFVTELPGAGFKDRNRVATVGARHLAKVLFSGRHD